MFKITKKNLIVVLIIVGLFVGWKLIFGRKKPYLIESYTVQKGEFVQNLSASGKVKAAQEASLAFQTSGQISWVGVKTGDPVKKGQYLAKLDTVVLNSAYMQALAGLRSAEATVEKIHDDVKGHSADETFTQKQTRTIAEVAKDSAYEAVIIAKKSLTNATLVSPLTGLVTAVSDNLIAGTNVVVGTTMVTVANPETVYFESEVNESEVVKLKEGQQVIIKIDAFPGKEFAGEVISIGFKSIITSTGGTAYQVKMSLPKDIAVFFRLGMKGDTNFILGRIEGVLKVPASAVVENNGKNYVWVINGGNKAERKEVEIGETSINETEIKSGIDAGEKVIVLPPDGLKNGDSLSN